MGDRGGAAAGASDRILISASPLITRDTGGDADGWLGWQPADRTDR